MARAVPLGDEQSVLEGYKWIFTIAQVALDVNVWADATRPRFVDIVGPYKKWGGDNVDAFYQYAPIDPTRTYRVRGRKGDAVYFSLSVYGGPNDGRYSERIVGTVHGRSGSFVLQHTAVSSRSGETTSWSVVPDSGTGELRGMRGTGEIVRKPGGVHLSRATCRSCRGGPSAAGRRSS